jgi:uncharacterized membrane protein YphA (DoxX/SURF4 family)
MASKTRTDWSLLLLRLAVGLAFVATALPQLRHLHGAASFSNALHIAEILGELVCGALLVLGLGMPWVVVPLLLIQGWPVVQALVHAQDPLSLRTGLLLLLATLASAVGGPGKWAIGKG